MVNKDKKNIISNLFFSLKEEYKFTKLWVFLITFGLTVSLLNISISLFKIDKLIFYNKEENSQNFQKSIVDKSINTNVDADTIIKNAIDSNITVTKTNQLLSGHLTRTMVTTNNHPVNYHNFVLYDTLGNVEFFDEFKFNETIEYGDCNEKFTNCVVYTSFQLENNQNKPICFEMVNTTTSGTKMSGTLIVTDYAKNNLNECIRLI